MAADAAGAVFGEFPGYGVYEYTPGVTAWRQLTAGNATLLAADSAGDVAGEFPGYGL